MLHLAVGVENPSASCICAKFGQHACAQQRSCTGHTVFQENWVMVSQPGFKFEAVSFVYCLLCMLSTLC